jgi:DNA modification methylase
MTPLKRALKDDGSVFIIIRPHVENGVEIDYLAPTINVVEASGWILIQRLIWYKPDAGPFGAEELPRRNYEYILWFAKTNKPYINLTAGGNPTKRKDTRRRGGRHGNLHADSSSPVAEGVARVTDVIVALVGEIDKVNHPAMFPPTLGRKLIPPFAPSYSLIVDPFAGAGTTCLVAQSLDYDFWGCDNGYEIIGENADGSPIYGDSFATIANRRLKTEAKYARGAAVALAGDALAVAAMAKGASA